MAKTKSKVKKGKLETLTEKYENASAKLTDLLQKREKLNEDIKKAQGEVDTVAGQIEQLKIEQMMKAAYKLGVSSDDILEALANRDFFALQDKIESNISGVSKSGTVSAETETEEAAEPEEAENYDGEDETENEDEDDEEEDEDDGTVVERPDNFYD